MASEVHNFTGDPAWVTYIQQLLIDEELLVAILKTESRVISITTKRIIVNENSGMWSVIRNSQISAVEVSQGRKEERFVEIHFGAGLTRTFSTPDEEQARYLTRAAAFGY